MNPGHFIIVTPTAVERELLGERWASKSGNVLRSARDAAIHLCGFGPVASAVATSRLIQESKPAWVGLIGIGGALCRDRAVGSAFLFEQVISHGIGVGEGLHHQSAESLGWRQVAICRGHLSSDRLALAIPVGLQSKVHGDLLTVCAASANEAEAAVRRATYPQATVEDMEGWGVALACQCANVPLVIVRGISNTAGDRDRSRWEIPAAMQAAADLMAAVVEDFTGRLSV